MAKVPQEEWNVMWKQTLPKLARARDPAQPKWPVTLDHCFARIILDNAVGITKPWMEIVKAPAVKNMSESQILAAIELGHEIADGRADLVALNENSLALRGKEGPKGRLQAAAQSTARKRKPEADEDDLKKRVASTKKSNTREVSISKYFQEPLAQSIATSPALRLASSLSMSAQKPKDKPLSVVRNRGSSFPQDGTASSQPQNATETDPLTLIATASLTPFRKEVLSLLCGIPPGQWTSYAAMSRHVNRVRGKTAQSKTCARAIGNAMRNNPFAPIVPCHRVLAADGKIGGFGGDWGEDGKHAGEKKRLLREEGVRFDGKGVAVGSAWEGWE
jgi:O-6-methylguanine DNA methyltransferase